VGNEGYEVTRMWTNEVSSPWLWLSLPKG